MIGSKEGEDADIDVGGLAQGPGAVAAIDGDVDTGGGEARAEEGEDEQEGMVL